MIDFDLNTVVGLSAQEVSEQLRHDGFNELPAGKKRGLLGIAHELIREPMFLLLLACGTIYFFLGEPQEASMLLGFVFFIAGITLYQERKTERTLEALRDLSSPRALVIRGGVQERIAGREVVRGDILVLVEGDRVPADALLLSGTNLLTDESILTGESMPVRKVAGDETTAQRRPGGDDLPFVFSGTLVVHGQGYAKVLATGAQTALGEIGKALESVETDTSPLQKEMARLVRNLAIFAISLCVIVTVVYGVTRADWLNGILAGLTLAMAILPNEFPVVLAIFMALGAWRISQQHVLTRRTPAIETLGSATVLCVDKTGTLTMNHMTVGKLFAHDQFYDIEARKHEALPEDFHQLVEFSILASQRDPFDPMDRALKQLGNLYLADTEHIHDDWALVREYPLSPELLALSRVWRSRDGADYIIGAKGAPEAIADLCHFNEAELQALARPIASLAEEGYRVLGAARSLFKKTDLPGQQHDFDFEFMGLVGLTDPVRATVPAAIEECYSAGIRVVMITGDYPGTALNIARQIGLSPLDEVITGPEIDLLTDAELQRRIETVNICARVVPEQKLRLVNALKANGEVVAMTGDGVNDAPALKAAHIGIAMGERGTDVAREAASLVLLDDDFSSIEQAVKLGRRVFDNLKKAMAYLLAVHVPIAGITLIPVILKWPLVLMPIHIAFLHLIIDPACSVVFEAEPEEADVMRRPPRDPRERLIDRRTLALSFLQGLGVLAILVAMYGISLRRGEGETGARALTFTTLIFANLGLILTNRSWSRTMLGTLRSRNAALWWVVGGALTFLGLVLSVPFLRKLFGFGELHLNDLGLCLAAGAVSILWFELFKLVGRREQPMASG